MFLYIFIIFMTFFGALGALCFKKAVNNVVEERLLLINPFIYAGLFCYITSAFLNIVLLNFLDYSILYPMTAITYIWSMFLARCCLGEKITVRKIIGVIWVLIGILMLII